ncbi:MAG: hypothetical protein SNG49_07650 [Rikenellaceae bacterium]
MKTYIKYLLLGLTLCACQSAIRYKAMPLETAIDKTGVIENYSFDESRPKVVTYIADITYFSSWVRSTNIDGVKEKIERYEDFEFLFYLGVQSQEELNKAIEMVERYNIEFPIYIDDQDKFRDRNIGDYKAPGIVTTILDPKNREYLCTVLALKLGGFDEHMEAAIKEMNK